jgi:hypothetical protein
VFAQHVLEPELRTIQVLFEMCGLGSDAVAFDLEILLGVFDSFVRLAAREAEFGTLMVAVIALVLY